MNARPITPLLGAIGLALLSVVACGDDKVTVLPNDPVGGSGGNAGSRSNPDDDDDQTGDDAGTGGTAGSAGSGGTGNSGGTSGSGGTGGTTADDGPVEVSGEIEEDTTWTADKEYILADLTYVVNNAVLTIEPGTVIKGGGVGSALIVTRGSRLVAEGTAEKPIVFTSNILPGLRDPGDWGGVALLGSAPINVPGGEAQLEGIEALEDRGAYGGNDAASDCGTVKYVRIEFAGFEFSVGNELNGLTLAGCGNGTEIDFVQVHRGSDDGVEVFGGTVDLKHIIVTNAEDDSLDWDFGWTGRAQFVVIRHDPVSDSGFEADNGDPSTDRTPRSEPTIYNATLIGSTPTPPATTGSRSPGMVLRRGTFGHIFNTIVYNFPVSGVDIRDAFSADGILADETGTAYLPELRLEIANSIFFNNGTDGTEHGDAEPTDGTTGDDDRTTINATPVSVDESDYLARAGANNQLDVDPGLSDAVAVSQPNFVPPVSSPAAAGAATPPAGFFENVSYIGALPPGGPDWTVGWTAYPED
jgi:hypothetical protein